MGVDVRQVGRRHPHRAPHAPVGQRGLQAILLRVAQEIAGSTFVVVVIARHLLHAREQCGRIKVGPVGQHHDVVAVVGERLRRDGVDDQRPVQAGLFLERGVAVVPVGTALVDGETIVVRLAAGDAVEAQARHAVHVGRQDDAVPVD